MSEVNKAMVRRMVEAINEGREDEAVVELFAPRAARRVGWLFAEFRSAFPDWHEGIVQLVAEGDTVAGRFRCSGTHRGEFLGEAATGKRMEVEEVFFMRAEEGRFAEFWALEDSLNRMRQLGLLPSRSSLQQGTHGRNQALGLPRTPPARSSERVPRTRLRQRSVARVRLPRRGTMTPERSANGRRRTVDFLRKRLPAQVGGYLEGVEFPARKEELLGRLERNGVPGPVVGQLRKRLPEGEYRGPQDVLSALRRGG